MTTHLHPHTLPLTLIALMIVAACLIVLTFTPLAAPITPGEQAQLQAIRARP